MFGIAGTAELSTFCPGTGTWNRLQDGIVATCPGGWAQPRGPGVLDTQRTIEFMRRLNLSAVREHLHLRMGQLCRRSLDDADTVEDIRASSAKAASTPTRAIRIVYVF